MLVPLPQWAGPTLCAKLFRGQFFTFCQLSQPWSTLRRVDVCTPSHVPFVMGLPVCFPSNRVVPSTPSSPAYVRTPKGAHVVGFYEVARLPGRCVSLSKRNGLADAFFVKAGRAVHAFTPSACSQPTGTAVVGLFEIAPLLCKSLSPSKRNGQPAKLGESATWIHPDAPEKPNSVRRGQHRRIQLKQTLNRRLLPYVVACASHRVCRKANQ